MVRYPSALALPVATGVAVMLVGALALGFRRRRISAGGIAIGVGTYALAVVVTTLLVTLVWAAARVLDSDCASIVLHLQLASDGSLAARLTDGSTGLPSIPGLVVQPRSPEFMPIPSPGMLGDATAVSKTYTVQPAIPPAD
jgi:hypothetical protein